MTPVTICQWNRFHRSLRCDAAHPAARCQGAADRSRTTTGMVRSVSDWYVAKSG
jgi:hypothetical protein